MEAMGRCVERLIPRLLSQACRDSTSAAYGAFDRDWWHYKIRDFPSIILQQGSYSVWLTSQMLGQDTNRQAMIDLAAAGCRFWNERATRFRAFEEYYPREEGYPPLAFSTLAVMKLAMSGVVPAESIKDGAGVAAKQLRGRFEAEAGNQQVAGLAALAWLRNAFPLRCGRREFQDISEHTLALQNSEGWFGEYGGPDLGYLSVTIDCLWDLYDATSDVRYRTSAASALRCIHRYVSVMGSSIGMHNARNTDYILPYGLTRFIVENTPEQTIAWNVLRTLYSRVEESNHFIHAVDDRYLCHYIGLSFIRALHLLSSSCDRISELPEPIVETEAIETVVEHAGHYLRRSPDGRVAMIVSLKKGGIITLLSGDNRVSDYGWNLRADGRQYVSHWWSNSWNWSRNGNTFVIKGDLAPARDYQSTPMRHMLLRVASACMGYRVTKHLKERMIFGKLASPYHFERQITCELNRVTVKDRISNVPSSAEVVPAPRSSKRHVASADTYHIEDLVLSGGIACQRSTSLSDGVFSANTVYEL